MPSIPTLVSDLLPVNFFRSTIARVASTIAATAKGAASGVADLSSAGYLPIEQMESGGIVRIRWAGSWPATRPTARTDVTVWSEAPSSISAPADWLANAPTWLIDGDRFSIRDGLSTATPMPVGDLPGWQQVTAVDFTTPVPIGGFVPNVDGVLTTTGLTGYNAYGPGRAGGALLEMYPNGWHTTGGVNGLQAPSQCVSVISGVPDTNGVLDIYCHTVTIGAETKPGTAVIHPVSLIGNPRRIGPYFRYGFRLRTTGFNGTGYTIVPLTIDPVIGNWPKYGELDWPECDCNTGTLVKGWYHRADPAGSQQAIPGDGSVVSDWHDYWVESLPGRVNFYLDDKLMLTSTTMTPYTALYFVLQGDVNTGTPAGPSVEGHIQVDWVAAYNLTSAELMHYDADTLLGVDGSAVASWPDVLGGRPALVQSNVASQPILAVDAVNGHNAVVWGDGVNRIMSVSGNAPDLFRNRSSAMVFIACTLSAAATTGICTLLGAGTPTGTNRVMVQARGTDGFINAGGRRLDADTLRTFSTGDAMPPSTPHVITVRYLWYASLMHVYLDGVLIGTDDPYQTAGLTSDTDALQMYVGAAVTGGADYHHGSIMEISVWSADNDTVRATTEAAMMAKYGI